MKHDGSGENGIPSSWRFSSGRWHSEPLDGGRAKVRTIRAAEPPSGYELDGIIAARPGNRRSNTSYGATRYAGWGREKRSDQSSERSLPSVNGFAITRVGSATTRAAELRPEVSR
jgi:hypothetical protein